MHQPIQYNTISFIADYKNIKDREVLADTAATETYYMYMRGIIKI